MPKHNLTAADVMCGGIRTVSPQTTLPELEEAFDRDQVTGFPVVDDGKLVGVVSHSDIVRQICTERHVAETVSDFHFDEKGFYEVRMESFDQIADRIGQRIESLSVADVMNRRPITVPLDMPINEVAHQFVSHQVHRLPVVDQGVLVGIITTIDLVRLIADNRFIHGE